MPPAVPTKTSAPVSVLTSPPVVPSRHRRGAYVGRRGGKHSSEVGPVLHLRAFPAVNWRSALAARPGMRRALQRSFVSRSRATRLATPMTRLTSRVESPSLPPDGCCHDGRRRRVPRHSQLNPDRGRCQQPRRARAEKGAAIRVRISVTARVGQPARRRFPIRGWLFGIRLDRLILDGVRPTSRSDATIGVQRW